MTQDLSPEAIKAIERAEKLLRLAGKNTNEAEAASATAKAMALLAAYNLDMSIIEQGGGEKSKRTDEKLKGGLYHFQRDLWHYVASLNFCMYWNQYRFDKDKVNRYQTRRQGFKVMGGYVFQHRVVGRVVNVIATRTMAEYLEQTIERLTKDRLMDVNTRRENAHQFQEALWGECAVQYRTGIADEICNKLYERRQEFLAEEQKKEHEAQERAAAAAKSGVATGTALSITSLAQSETDANQDFLYGEGYSAEERMRIAENARLEAEAEAAYTQWAADNPEEAAAEEAARRKAAKRIPWNAGTGADKDHRKYGQAYYAGRDAGKDVSIDQQVSDPNSVRKIAGKK
jgi:hypothetical protein